MTWQTATLGDLFVLKYGKSLPERNRVSTGTVPVYGSNGVVGRHDKAITSGPTIIVGRKGSAGRIAYSETPCWPIDTTYFIDDFGDSHDSRFWAYQFTSLRLDEFEKSSAIPGLNRDDAYTRECTFPDLNEQRRVARKLDHIVAHLDNTRARLENIPAILKRFRMSVLAAACSGRLTEDWRKDRKFDGAEPITAESQIDLPELPGTWRYARLGEIITGQKYGTSKRCTYERIGRPVLRIPNIGEGGVIDGGDLKYGELPDSEYEQLALRDGDLLLIRSNGSVSLVGRCSLVTPEFRGYAYAGYLIRLRPDDNQVLPEYLIRAMAAPTLRVQIELPARSTSGVNNINSSEVGNLLVPLPPLEEQAEIACRIGAMFKQADAIEARYGKAKTFTDKLMPSVLAKAFRGELACERQ